MTDSQGQLIDQAFVFNASGSCVDGARCSGSLTSPPILLPAAGPAYLRFNQRFASENPRGFADRRWIMYSSSSTPDGPYSQWLNVTELSGDLANTWLPGPDGLDLLQVASGSLAGKYVRIRFFYDSIDTQANSGTSWTVDNVRVEAAAPAAADDANEPNNKTTEATWITLGGTKSGTISPGGDSDYFRFSALKGQALVVDVTSPGAGLDPALALFDTDGSSLMVQSAGPGPGGTGTARVSFAVPQDGIYYLRVRPRNFPAGGAGAAYTLSLVQPADPTRPAIQLLSLVSGQAQPPWPLVLSVQANDGSGTGISHVDFFYHLPDWINGHWIWIGSDWNGADGWGIPFYPGKLPEVEGFSVWARAYDWALNPADAISYHAWAGTGIRAYLPIMTN